MYPIGPVFKRATRASRVGAAHPALNKIDRAWQEVCYESGIGGVMQSADIQLDDAQSDLCHSEDTLEKAKELMTAGGFRGLPSIG